MAFDVDSDIIGRNIVRGSAGVTARIGSRFRLYVDYHVRAGTGFGAQAVTAGVGF